MVHASSNYGEKRQIHLYNIHFFDFSCLVKYFSLWLITPFFLFAWKWKYSRASIITYFRLNVNTLKQVKL